MHYLKLTTDADGETHFSAIPIEAPQEWAATSIKLVRVAPNLTSDLHPEPAPTLATALSGSITISASDGTQHQLAPGTAILFLDTTGPGHTFANGPAEALLLITRLADATI